MDFSEIKDIWNKSYRDEQRLSSSQIEGMLRVKHRSNSALQRIKKSFKIELITGGLMYLFIVTMLFSLMDLSYSLLFFAIVTILMGAPYYFYLKNYRRIRNTSYSEDTLKGSLANTLADIKKFIESGSRLTFKIVMIPIATLTGIIIGLIIGTGNSDLVEIIGSLRTASILKIVILPIVFTALLLPFTRFYFKRQFQNHYEELKSCFNELKEDE